MTKKPLEKEAEAYLSEEKGVHDGSGRASPEPEDILAESHF